MRKVIGVISIGVQGSLPVNARGVALRSPLTLVVVSALLWAAMLAACAGQANAEGRMIVDGRATPCVDEPAPTEDFLQCPQAIRLAVLRLGLSPGAATALEFYREPCGTTAEQPTECAGYVVAWFAADPPQLVRIIPHRTGGFSAHPGTATQELIDRGPIPVAPGS
jgi:hypothetical protein